MNNGLSVVTKHLLREMYCAKYTVHLYLELDLRSPCGATGVRVHSSWGSGWETIEGNTLIAGDNTGVERTHSLLRLHVVAVAAADRCCCSCLLFQQFLLRFFTFSNTKNVKQMNLARLKTKHSEPHSALPLYAAPC